MKVSIVIPNYNGEKLLRENLPKIIDQIAKQYGNLAIEIIIVDDASEDASASVVSGHLSAVRRINKNIRLKLIQNHDNLGFSSTVNRGVKEAEGDIVVLLNTDACPEAGFLEAVFPHFKDKQVFAVGCLQESKSWKGITKQGRGIGSFKKGFLVHGPGDIDGNDTLWVFGGAGVYRRTIWEKLGGMDELYNPFYWEDIDLSYRAAKAGYKLVFEPKSIVCHSQGESIKAAYSSHKIKTIAYRNQILFVWLNITDFSLLLQHVLFFPYHILKAFFCHDFAFIRGFAEALISLPKALYQRRLNKRLNKISDRKILDKFRF